MHNQDRVVCKHHPWAEMEQFKKCFRCRVCGHEETIYICDRMLTTKEVADTMLNTLKGVLKK